MNARFALLVALAFAILHAGLAIYYSAITPYRQPGILLGQRDPATGRQATAKDIGAPDERQHANYIQRLMDGKGFPVLEDPNEDSYENYQAHQPPLYYLLAAGWSKITGTIPADSDHGRPARWLNALLGGATVVGTYFLGAWGLRRPEAGVIGAAFVALLPMNVALSGAISNDPLLFALCTWVLALCGLALRDGWTWKRAIAVGLLTGASLLTKTTAVALLPILLLAAFIPQTRKPTLAMVGAVAALALILAAPWWVRNQRLYGDPLAMSAFQKAFTGNPTPDTFIEPLQSIGESPVEAKWTYWMEGVGWWTARSFFGVFGYMDIWLNENGRSDTFPSALSKKGAQPNTLYRVLFGATFIVFAAWVWATFRPEYRDERSIQLLYFAFALIVVALFIRFNMQYFQGQARYLFPALGPIGVGVGVGSLQLSRGKWMYPLCVVMVALLALNIFTLSRLPEAFAARTGEISQTPGT